GAQATLDLARSEVRTAEIDLGYCRVITPIDGMIDRRAFDIGNYITDDSSTILASIVRVNPIYAYAAISEAELLRVKKRYPENGNQVPIPVRMAIGEDHSFPFEGRIDYISPSVQTQTGTVQIRGVFENTGIVMPGMFIRVRIPVEETPNAMLVSERSLGYDQAGTYVYVVTTENKIERRAVTPGDAINGNRVITGDVKFSDKIVADGLLKVRPGMTVTPTLSSKSSEDEPAAESGNVIVPVQLKEEKGIPASGSPQSESPKSD
ncbi:MAG TPA: efflux RND transporter periplasmic adaptor subunit, partial [Planctomicrobium sp.]|nr:efflux RND transporter periplasmic adaptor subunit [Planctomicrobium sp.]